MAAVDFMPPELLRLAEAVRAEMADLPEHIIRRRVRDKLYEAKIRQGLFARKSWGQLADDLSQAITTSQQASKPGEAEG
jgi:hypothetical protein